MTRPTLVSDGPKGRVPAGLGLPLAGSTVAVPGRTSTPWRPTRPRLEVLDAIDDATAQLRIARAGAVDPMLLQRANGQADETGGLGGAQIARAAGRRKLRAREASVILWEAAGKQRPSRITMATTEGSK